MAVLIEAVYKDTIAFCPFSKQHIIEDWFSSFKWKPQNVLKKKIPYVLKNLLEDKCLNVPMEGC